MAAARVVATFAGLCGLLLHIARAGTFEPVLYVHR